MVIWPLYGFHKEIFLNTLCAAAMFSIAFALVLYGLLLLENRFMAKGLIYKISDASYSIYLVHYYVWCLGWPVLKLLGFNQYFAFVLLCACSVLLGMLFHRYIEEPLTGRCMRRTNIKTMPGGRLCSSEGK